MSQRQEAILKLLLEHGCGLTVVAQNQLLKHLGKLSNTDATDLVIGLGQLFDTNRTRFGTAVANQMLSDRITAQHKAGWPPAQTQAKVVDHVNHKKVLELLAVDHGLTRWEAQFAESLVRQLESGSYLSPAQLRKVDQILTRLDEQGIQATREGQAPHMDLDNDGSEE